MGLLDLEINTLTKVLFMFVTLLSVVMMVLKVSCQLLKRSLVRYLGIFFFFFVKIYSQKGCEVNKMGIHFAVTLVKVWVMQSCLPLWLLPSTIVVSVK